MLSADADRRPPVTARPRVGNRRRGRRSGHHTAGDCTPRSRAGPGRAGARPRAGVGCAIGRRGDEGQERRTARGYA
ncbi:MAG: hypothetical protein AVDCRST_MAG49-4059 [uncultured Thermomicrobiales bacterium]|uniref:Uncharacterized protein n=1 Tax=uncultured Thermomicrobiales bacterium TaxID=1645740 RepID=A0A6J4VC08_9BACT|nr:MAG: hypothetical protein AVDCRST_MAG49-4059 [uncultured Thermomicrobiales bacterium]